MEQFTHLHVHSQYSILDGAASVQGLVEKAKEYGMKSIALTDHGNMFGVKHFYDVAKKNGIKPIIGMEAYVARNNMGSRSGSVDRSGYHLIILAKNKIGYENLMKLSSLGFLDGFYYKPRIDREILEKHSEGLIVTSACLGGEIPQNIMNGNEDALKETILWYKRVFGDDYYLELMRHKTNNPQKNAEIYDRQEECNQRMIELGKEYSVKLIATNDVHFLNEGDAESHDLLICLNTGRDLDDPNRMRYTKEEYLKSPEDMMDLFCDIPESIQNTIEIESKIEEYELNSEPLMPDFPLPDTFTNEDDYLRYLAYEGAKKRWGTNLSVEIKERLDFELSTIKSMGFPGYFLIVWDFIKAARGMGVVVGCGRGSAAGSAVAYCIEITNVDPLKYDLLFERFLNPDRISMPDVDIDFDDDGRQSVMDWVVEKYGYDRVAQITTFGTMASKMAIKDVARVVKLPLSEAKRLTGLIPEGVKISLKQAFEESSELEDERRSDNPLVVQTLKHAVTLEGCIRQTGVHACGVIIGKDALINHIPVMKVKDNPLMITQYDGRFVEPVGMLKMDFLGLKTLSVIKEALINIERSKGLKLNVDEIPMNDVKTFELFSKGETTGVFQFESAGMKKYLKMLQPGRFGDLVAMNALYRPGPIEYIPSFIKRKHGEEEIIYDHPIMEGFLGDTYGITVYQEQVMLQSRALAGFTRGMSDTLRKAMGKKQIDVMNKLKIQFTDGCIANPKFMDGVADEEEAHTVIDKIWTDWEAFAKYAFNKSHSVCYAMIAYQTGYLKAHYPAEFMAAVLSRNLSDMDKISIFMTECKRMGLEVKSPNINESFSSFTVNNKGQIVFGLAGIKGVGLGAVDSIISERKKGEYTDIHNFFERVDLKVVNNKNTANLAKSGSFDLFGYTRKEVNNSSKDLVSYGKNFQKDNLNIQPTLFGEAEGYVVDKVKIGKVGKWEKLKFLAFEKELLGIYLSAHPLDDYKIEFDNFCNVDLRKMNENLKNFKDSDIYLAVIITNVRRAITKTGNSYAIITVEDFNDSYDLAFFGKDFINFNNFFIEGLFIFINARVQSKSWSDDPDDLEVKIREIEYLENKITHAEISMSLESLTDEIVMHITDCLYDKRGTIGLDFKIRENGIISNATKIKVCRANLKFFLNSEDIKVKLN